MQACANIHGCLLGPAHGMAGEGRILHSPLGELRLHAPDLWSSPQLLLLTVPIFLGLGQPRSPKGKKKGHGRPGAMPLDLVLRAKPYARMEEYERNLGEMVALLRNSSEPAQRKCEVNLQLWLSNKRSLSPWGYRWALWAV